MSQKLELSNEKIFNVHSFSALNNMNISIVLYGTTLSEVESEFTKENLTMIRVTEDDNDNSVAIYNGYSSIVSISKHSECIAKNDLDESFEYDESSVVNNEVIVDVIEITLSRDLEQKLKNLQTQCDSLNTLMAKLLLTVGGVDNE